MSVGGDDLSKLDKIRCVDGENIYYLPHDEWQKRMERNLGYISVFTGSRGSGKTLSMTYWAVNFLPAGYKVWSNYKIRFPWRWPGGRVEWFETSPLDMNSLYTFDSDLAGGVVLIDEINLWASNRRSMSVANRLINSVMQLLRKRKLTFMFTCQNFDWLDSQLRFQTDAHILCHDQHYNYPGRYRRGEMIRQVWRDMSGVYTGSPYYQTGKEYPIFFHGKRFWDCYNSWEEFDVYDASRSIVVRQDKKVIDRRTNAELVNDTGNKSFSEALGEIASYGMNELTSIEAQELLASQGFNVDARQVGRYMKRLGYIYKQTRQGNFYIKG